MSIGFACAHLSSFGVFFFGWADPILIRGTWVAVDDDDEIVSFYGNNKMDIPDYSSGEYSIAGGKLFVDFGGIYGSRTCDYKVSIFSLTVYDEDGHPTKYYRK